MMMEEATAYQVLGLQLGADTEAIKKAYHALVKACHPDQFPAGERQQQAQEELVRLNLAYEQALKTAQDKAPVPCQEMPLPEAKAFAKRLLKAGQYESALRQLARTPDKDAEYYFIQGEILYALKEYGSAHQAYRAAVRIDPVNQTYHRAAFQAAVTYKKHQRLPYRIADWAGGLFHPRRRDNP